MSKAFYISDAINDKDFDNIRDKQSGHEVAAILFVQE